MTKLDRARNIDKIDGISEALRIALQRIHRLMHDMGEVESRVLPSLELRKRIFEMLTEMSTIRGELDNLAICCPDLTAD